MPSPIGFSIAAMRPRAILTMSSDTSTPVTQ